MRLSATAFAACALAGSAQAGQHEPGYALKAGYLSKFTPFVDWPDAAFEGPASPFRICIGGRDPFGGVIDRIIGGQRVGDHPMVVIRLATVARGVDCHLLFLGGSRQQSVQQMLALVAGRPVLTVADEGQEVAGAMVQFVTVEGRLRFSIHADTAQAAGLAVSSKLLALSTTSREGGK